MPYIETDPILLVPKRIVRRKLALDGQEFYNKQITDFLVAETYRAGGALVKALKSGEPKVYKTEVREHNPRSKALIADTVLKHPELLDLYKTIASKQGVLFTFDDDSELPTFLNCLILAIEHFHWDDP